MNAGQIRKLTEWIANLDVDTAKKLHHAYNAASLSALEGARRTAEVEIKAKGQTSSVKRAARTASGAVDDAAVNDKSRTWHGAWPMVAAAVEDAVWGITTTNQYAHEVLTGPVRAAGFREG